MEIKRVVRDIPGYPTNGKHLECLTSLPFSIKKGEDGYYYHVKGVEKKYNLSDETTDKWIIHIDNNKHGVTRSLINIFEVKTSKNLEKLLKYAVKVYIKSLKMELSKWKNGKK